MKFTAIITFGIMVLAAALFMPQTSMAQALCGERDNFLTHLGKNHKEAPAAMGVTSSGRVIEVLTSENGSWTIIVTHPNGTSCMLAAGEAWEEVERIAMGPTT
tara:strand:+ start:18295 stop:18603 length:309 start_codon:yes stop_codon:yes gene_type:complete